MKACCVSFDVSRTKLETFPVLGWKSQLIISKGKVHRAYLSKSDKNGIQEMLETGCVMVSMAPEGMQAEV